MNLEIDDIKVNYKESGKGRSVVLLHGWGAEIKTFEPVHENLEKHFRTISLDLPGFGKSSEPLVPWNVNDYAVFLAKFLKKLGIEEPILIGHSFGGRVVIRFAAENKVKKIVLIDSAGIKPVRGLAYYIKIYTFKTCKLFFRLPLINKYGIEYLNKIRNKVGSSDYSQASETMKQTLVQTVNEDLRTLLPQIKAPTLLIWGENDTATPPADGVLMEKLIPGSGLVVLKNAGHYSYLDKYREFIIILNNFLHDEMELNKSLE